MFYSFKGFKHFYPPISVVVTVKNVVTVKIYPPSCDLIVSMKLKHF